MSCCFLLPRTDELPLGICLLLTPNFVSHTPTPCSCHQAQYTVHCAAMKSAVHVQAPAAARLKQPLPLPLSAAGLTCPDASNCKLKRVSQPPPPSPIAAVRAAPSTAGLPVKALHVPVAGCPWGRRALRRKAASSTWLRRSASRVWISQQAVEVCMVFLFLLRKGEEIIPAAALSPCGDLILSLYTSLQVARPNGLCCCLGALVL